MSEQIAGGGGQKRRRNEQITCFHRRKVNPLSLRVAACEGAGHLHHVDRRERPMASAWHTFRNGHEQSKGYSYHHARVSPIPNVSSRNDGPAEERQTTIADGAERADCGFDRRAAVNHARENRQRAMGRADHSSRRRRHGFRQHRRQHDAIDCGPARGDRVNLDRSRFRSSLLESTGGITSPSQVGMAQTDGGRVAARRAHQTSLQAVSTGGNK